jgi:hypothetical protein
MNFYLSKKVEMELIRSGIDPSKFIAQVMQDYLKHPEKYKQFLEQSKYD